MGGAEPAAAHEVALRTAPANRQRPSFTLHPHVLPACLSPYGNPDQKEDHRSEGATSDQHEHPLGDRPRFSNRIGEQIVRIEVTLLVAGVLMRKRIHEG